MNKKGWLVTFGGLALNLALGVLYAWSMFSKQLTEEVAKGGFGWSRTEATLPYTIAIAFFAATMVPAGRLQDKLGPRVVATAGALLCSLGLFIAGFGSPELLLPTMVGFGVLAGTGIGLGYAAATPAAVKWFSADRKGLITGLVVAGFGLAPVYIAPLSKYLLTNYGISASFRILGVAFLVSATLFAQLIRNPPPGFTPPAPANKKKGPPKPAVVDATWREMLRSPRFYSLYFQYACAATAGLMIIGHVAKIVSVQSNNAVQAGFFFVALLAVFNASGRVVAGLVSDTIGRVSTMVGVFFIQALTMLAFSQFSTFATFVFGVALVGFNYGACLSLFPAATADVWGAKNLGLNYGILFTAWGLGGVFGPILAGKIADATGAYTTAYFVSGGLMILAAMLAMVSHILLTAREPEPEGQQAG